MVGVFFQPWNRVVRISKRMIQTNLGVVAEVAGGCGKFFEVLRVLSFSEYAVVRPFLARVDCTSQNDERLVKLCKPNLPLQQQQHNRPSGRKK